MIHGTFVPNYEILEQEHERVETEGALHLVKISANFGSAVNGKRFIGWSHWKIPRKSGKSEKVGPFSRLERSERNCAFHPQAFS